MKRVLVLIAFAVAGLLSASLLANAAPPGAFCERKPTHQKCQTTTTTTTTTDTTTTTTPPPPPPPPSSLPAFGIAAWDSIHKRSLTDIRRELDSYVQIHATWIRLEFSWDEVEPVKGQFNWAGYDNVVNEANARGIKVLALVDYTPAWANGGHTDHNYEPTDPNEFGRFAGDVARRFSPKGVHHYEIWNEPNIGFWKPTPDPVKYTAVLKASYTSIHAADSQALVVTGGLSPEADTKTIGFLKGIYAAGGGGYFDGVGYHPYVDATDFTVTSNGYIWGAMAERTEDFRDVMVANGDGAKLIWATEVGCDPRKVTNCTSRIGWAFERWSSYSWAAAIYWFTYYDPGAYGLVDGSWNPRPLWYAYQTAAA